ncbi:reverse transcriptase domain-containing protein [Tanacetum coccineum]|uniref:Reverse transcriptase domain-containing protein n=1 Tax=Tanacetum coccineum TaxID=301880 RepID=A0ABQ4X448_9ASTR
MDIRISRLEKMISEKNVTTPATVKAIEESIVINFKNSASTSRIPGTIPSQTVTNPHEQINVITTRSGKTLEGPSTPLVPTPVSIPSKEPEQNPETSTKKVQNPNLENTAHPPVPEEEDSHFIKHPQPKAKKTVNQLGLEALTPTRMTLELANRSITHPMGIAEDVVVRVDGFTFLADFVVVNFELDPRVPIILGRPFLRTAKALIDLYEEKLTLRVGKEELVYYADKSKKNKEKKFFHAISIIDFLKDDTLRAVPTNSHPMLHFPSFVHR